MRSLFVLFLPCLLLAPGWSDTEAPATGPAPDIVVAADGSGQFTSVQQAIESVPEGNTQRIVILVKPGAYEEQVLIDKRSNLTLLGEDPERTIIVADIPFPDWRDGKLPDAIGRSVVNLGVAHGIIFDGLTIRNSADVEAHTFAIDDIHATGEGVVRATDRIIVQNCHVEGKGLDTLSLWRHGDYYIRNVYVSGLGHFLGIRGTAYTVDTTLDCLKRGYTVLFHDGGLSPDEKLVLRDCRFAGAGPFSLGSCFGQAAFYLIDCVFPAELKDEPILRSVSLPDGSYQAITEGLPVFFSGSQGPDYAWLQDNLSEAPGAPTPDQVTAAWTFGGRWNPERTDAPTIVAVGRSEGRLTLKFSEDVTVKGSPTLALNDGQRARFVGGSGSSELCFEVPEGCAAGPVKLELGEGGAIIASLATTSVRNARLSLPG